MRKFCWSLLTVLLWILICGPGLLGCRRMSSVTHAPGSKGGPCFSDGTCEPGLRCEENLCLSDNDSGSEIKDGQPGSEIKDGQSANIDYAGHGQEAGTDGKPPLSDANPLLDSQSTKPDQEVAHCGDGVRQTSEACEGYDFGQASCLDNGQAHGLLICNSNCTIDYSQCGVCVAPSVPGGINPTIIVSAADGNDTTADGRCKPFRTITAALKQRKSGDVVWVAPGTYDATLGETFPISVPSGVKLVGDEANKGNGTNKTAVVGAYASGSIYFTMLPLEGATIAGLQISVDYVSSQTRYGINISQVSATIRNNTFTDSNTGINIVTPYSSSINATIEGNVFNSSVYGLLINAVGTINVSGNIFDAPTVGISHQSGQLIAKNNNFSKVTDTGILLTTGSATLTNNNFSQATGYKTSALQILRVSTLVMRQNNFSLGAGKAVYIDSGDYNMNIDAGTSSSAGGNTFPAAALIGLTNKSNSQVSAVGNTWTGTTASALLCGKQIVPLGWGRVYWGGGANDFCSKTINEFRVNTYTTGEQALPQVGQFSDGRFIISWSGAGATTTTGIYAQQYSSNGQKVGSEIYAGSTGTTGRTHNLATFNDGHFVVAWNANSSNMVSAQLFDSSGNKSGTTISVSSLAGTTDPPLIATLADGRFMISYNLQEFLFSVKAKAQRFAADGTKAGTEIDLALGTSGTARLNKYLFTNSSGQYDVIWNQDGSMYSSIYDAAGSKVGTDVLIKSSLNSETLFASWSNDDWLYDYRTASSPYCSYVTIVRAGVSSLSFTYSCNQSVIPNSVGAIPGGNFIVSYLRSNELSHQRYNSAGTALGTEVPVNGYQVDAPAHSRIATFSDGHFLIVWDNNYQDGSGHGIYGQMFNAQGAPY